MNISKNLKHKIFSKEAVVSMIVTALVFILDRVTKTAIVNHQTNNDSIFVNDYLNFDLVWNTGISFGLLSYNANIYYHLISLIIFLVIIYLIFLTIQANYLEKILFSLILGGATGNLYDRLFYFAVPDFIDFHIDDFHWFTFNIADIFISFGIIIFLTNGFFKKDK